MRRQAPIANKVKITKVERARGVLGERLKVYFLLGRTRLNVCVDSDDFSERNLKKAIARKIVCEFAFRRAKCLIGMSFSIDDVLREYHSDRNFADLL